MNCKPRLGWRADKCKMVCGSHLMPDYTAEHSRAGIDVKLPKLETWPNHFPGYEITIRFPEYTSVCPKTGLPDYGAITVRYEPKRVCLELKALKMYLLAYRNLGIFYENAVNRMLRDIVAATKPAVVPRDRRIYATWRFDHHGRGELAEGTASAIDFAIRLGDNAAEGARN